MLIQSLKDLQMKQLNESRNLKTPVFVGTTEESLAAARSWLTMVSYLRNINNDVTDYNNKLTILQNLQVEIGELLGDVKNSSNTVVTNTAEIPTMVPPEYEESEECCPPGLTESQIKDIKRLSGIKDIIKSKTSKIEGMMNNATK